MESDNLTEAEKVIISNSSNKKVFYLATLKSGIIKFGIFDNDLNINNYLELKKYFGPEFIIKYIIETDHNNELLDNIRKECNNKESPFYSRRIKMNYGEKSDEDIFYIDSNFTIKDAYIELLEFTRDIEHLEYLFICEKIKGLERDYEYACSVVGNGGIPFVLE